MILDRCILSSDITLIDPSKTVLNTLHKKVGKNVLITYGSDKKDTYSYGYYHRVQRRR